MLGLRSIANINAALIQVVDVANMKLEVSADMRDAQRRVAIAARNIVLLSDEREMAAHKATEGTQVLIKQAVEPAVCQDLAGSVLNQVMRRGPVRAKNCCFS